MNTVTRTLITTFPLLCAAGVAAAPAAAHPDVGGAPHVAQPATAGDASLSPIRGGGGATGAVVLAQPPERREGGPILQPQRGATPGTVPVVPTPPHRQDPAIVPDHPSGPVGSRDRVLAVVPVVMPRRELVPATVPVRVTVHDLGSAPARPHGVDQSTGARSEIEIVVRARGGSGSAAELPTVLREMLRTLAAQQRVPTPRPHR